MKEVDCLGVGQFSNIQQNTALCSAIISKVNNGAVAVGRCEPRLTHAVSHPLSFAQKKKASEFRCFLFWWEEVDSFNSGTDKFTCISGASAPKRWFRRNAPRGLHRAESTIPTKKKTPHCDVFFLVGRGGFEPPKAVPTDLQSAPFGHSGIFPRLELVVGVEPTTC